MHHKGQQTDSPTCISCGNDAQEICCQSCVIDKIENAKVQNKNYVKSLIQPLVAELESLKEENKLLKLDLKALTSKTNAIEGRQKEILHKTHTKQDHSPPSATETTIQTGTQMGSVSSTPENIDSTDNLNDNSEPPSDQITDQEAEPQRSNHQQTSTPLPS